MKMIDQARLSGMLWRLIALFAGIVLLARIIPVGAQVNNSQPAQASASIVDCIRSGTSQGLATYGSPRFATTCFSNRLTVGGYADPGGVWGPYDPPASNEAMISFGDGQPDQIGEPGHTVEGRLGQIGAVYGLTFSSGTNPAAPALARSQRLFAGAYTKRMTRYGPGGPGAIYVRDPINRTINLYVTVPAVVPGPGGAAYAAGDGSRSLFPNGLLTAGATYTPEMGGTHSDGFDTVVLPWIGKTGLGDIEIDAQEQYLYAVNLNDKAIYRFDTWSVAPQGTMQRLELPAIFSDPQACNGGGPADLRPFGLHITRDAIYQGFTCTAEGSQNRAQLMIGVMRYNLASSSWDTSPVVSAALSTYDGQRGTYGSIWRPWRSSDCGYLYPPPSPDNLMECQGGYQAYTQPILSDIVIDERGRMVLGLRDRFMDLSGNPAIVNHQGYPQGDLLIANPASATTWNTPVGEFYRDEGTHGVFTPNYDLENTSGALAYLPGQHDGSAGGEILTSFLDPYTTNSFGVAWYDSSGGPITALENMYWLGTDPNYGFGKASGLGDIELLCAWAAIGDRVWRDDTGDGIQNSGEPGIDGVRLQLFAAADTSFATPLATVTTGDLDGDGQGGEYQFYVAPFQAYQVRIDPLNFASGGVLAGKIIAPQNRGGNDQLDSDADQIQYAVLIAALAKEQQVHSYDIGIMDAWRANGLLGDRVWQDTNNDGVQNTGESGAGGVAVRLLACQDRVSVCANPIQIASTTTDSSGAYLFQQIPPNYYRIEFVPPPGYVAAPLNRGGNDAFDSDADQTTGWRAAVLPISADTINRASDLGLTPIQTNLRLTISGPATALLGEQFSYTLAYANGPALATNTRITYSLPAGLTFASATGTPARSGQALTWNLGTLNPNQSGSVSITVRAATIGAQNNAPAITSDALESDYSDNTARLTTIIQQANLGVTLNGPATVAPGETFSYQITVSNPVNSVLSTALLAAAENVQVSNTLPAGLIFVSANPVASTTSGRTRTWNLGTVASSGSRSITLLVRASTAQPYPTSFTSSVVASTSTPDYTLTDDSDTLITTVRYPNLRISSINGPVRTAELSNISYTVNYANNGPEDADATTLVVVLPGDVTFQGAGGNPAYDAVAGELTWSLGTLASGASGSILINMRVNSGAVSPLVVSAGISTITPEPNLADNNASATTAVIAPPPPPTNTGGLQLAIHSELDPLSSDNWPENAVYRSSGTAISWPVGEVLDFSPRMILTLPVMPVPENQFYGYQAQISGWILTSMTAGGRTYRPTDADSLGRSGCRLGGSTVAAGCAYSYIGGQSISDTDQPSESQMANQAHLFFATDRPIRMRSDVYTYTIPELQAVTITVRMSYRVQVINLASGAIVRSQVFSRDQSYRVNLIMPRSVK